MRIKLLAIICLAALPLCGCRIYDYQGQNGERFKIVSVGEDSTIGKLDFDSPDKKVRLENLDRKAKALDSLSKMLDLISSAAK